MAVESFVAKHARAAATILTGVQRGACIWLTQAAIYRCVRNVGHESREVSMLSRNATRSSAFAEKPRDSPCRLQFLKVNLILHIMTNDNDGL